MSKTDLADPTKRDTRKFYCGGCKLEFDNADLPTSAWCRCPRCRTTNIEHPKRDEPSWWRRAKESETK